MSLLPGSPISETATAIGRAVKGVYNKVLNFRHIDPRDARSGFSGAGEGDRLVWNEFYDPATQEIRAVELEAEFQRVWGQSGTSDPADQTPIPPSPAEISESQYRYRPGPVRSGEEFTVTPQPHDQYFVYVLELSNKKAVKVGYSSNPVARLTWYKKAILKEITGLDWRLAFKHAVETPEAALEVEQMVLERFKKHKLGSNGEVLLAVDTMKVQLAIIAATEEVLSTALQGKSNERSSIAPIA